MQPRYLKQGFFAFVLCFTLASCKKEDVANNLENRKPPKVSAESRYPVVGSDIDSLVLYSSADYTYENKERPFSRNWKAEWKCTMKPDGAPEPIILSRNEMIAYATGLEPGEYQFEVGYSTQVLTRKASIDVSVVKAKPSGTVIVSERVNWKLIEDDWGSPYPAGFWTSDPTIFYYSGTSKLPVVEYQDPVNGQWKKVAVYASPEYRNYSTIPSQNEKNGRADIYFYDSKMNLTIQQGLTPDFLQAIIAKPPAVRITYP